MTELQRLVAALRAGRGFVHKGDIGLVLQGLGDQAGTTVVPNGDDCAVLPDAAGGEHLLLAIEGLLPEFVEAMPWFAGYSGVMVNLSDVAAMGGRALAVVDALWSTGDGRAGEIVAGMRAACERYGVPLVGGHSNLRCRGEQLAVAVLGRAKALISSFAARPGDRLLMAVDLRGEWQGAHPFWNASTPAPPQRLRADLALLPELAEAGLCDAGKDISMAGALGSLLMLLEASQVGAEIALERVPAPPGVLPWAQAGERAEAGRLRWLSAFPSYGFMLSVRPANAAHVMARFASREIECADIGEVVAGSRLTLSVPAAGAGRARAELWNLAEAPFISGRARS